MKMNTKWYYYEGAGLKRIADESWLPYMTEKVHRRDLAIPPTGFAYEDPDPLSHWIEANGYHQSQAAGRNMLLFRHEANDTYLLVAEVLGEYHLVELTGFDNLNKALEMLRQLSTLFPSGNYPSDEAERGKAAVSFNFPAKKPKK